MASTDAGHDADPAPTPAYVADEAPGTRSGRRAAWLVASGAAVVVVLLLAVVALNRPDRSVPPAPGTEDRGTTDIGVAAPWDGKASLRLPVTVTPNRDLVDGQEVVVSGHGFPPNADLGVLMCTNAAVFSGIGACDIGTALSSLKGFPIVSDANGDFTTRYRVTTHIAVSTGGAAAPSTIVHDDGTVGAMATAPLPIDSATGDIDPDVWPSVIPPSPSADPGGFTCIVAVGMVSDYDKSGGAAVGFAGSVFRTFPSSATEPPPEAPTPASDATGATEPTVAAEPAPDPVSPPSMVTTTYGVLLDGGASTTTTGPPPDAPPDPGPGSTTTTAPA